jgi:uncharacterized membrane protein
MSVCEKRRRITQEKMNNSLQYASGAIDAGGCITNGWELVKRNYWLYFGIAIVAMLLAGCIPCVSLFLVGPITGGVYYVLFREMRGEPVDFGMMFKGFDKFLPLMVIGIIQSIPEMIGQGLRFSADFGRGVSEGLNRGGSGADFYQNSSDALPILAGGLITIVIIIAVILILFGIVWRVLLFFSIPLALERDLGPIDAMKLSAKAATSNLGGLIVLIILEALMMIAGVIALCVGMFFVLPIIYAANAFAYRAVFPWVQQTFHNVPPPPDSYESFGRV